MATNQVWKTQICPGDQTGCSFTTSRPDVITVSAMNVYGNISLPASSKKDCFACRHPVPKFQRHVIKVPVYKS